MLPFKAKGDKRKRAFIFLHGFLGSSEDFEETVSRLEDEFYCVSVDLVAPDMPSPFYWIISTIENLIRAHHLIDPILVGYSMGGRIAHIFQNVSKLPCHTFIIGSHLGIRDPKERLAREKWEEKIEEKLQTYPLDAFIDKWYEKPIFSSFRNHPSFTKYAIRRKENDADQMLLSFNQFRLTHQPVFSPHNRSHFFCGDSDDKYIKYYRSQNIFFHTISDSGHVCHLEQPKKLATKIKEVIYGNVLETKR